MREGMNPPNPIHPRTLATTWRDDFGNSEAVISVPQLQSFSNEVTNSVNGLVEHINYIHRRLGDLQHIEEFMSWIDLTYPELRRDFITSQRVAKRLAPDDGAVMVECEG